MFVCHYFLGDLVPGCWNRVVNGDEVICHCDKKAVRRIVELEKENDALKAALKGGEI
jgi:hypothetical protein